MKMRVGRGGGEGDTIFFFSFAIRRPCTKFILGRILKYIQNTCHNVFERGWGAVTVEYLNIRAQIYSRTKGESACKTSEEGV